MDQKELNAKVTEYYNYSKELQKHIIKYIENYFKKDTISFSSFSDLVIDMIGNVKGYKDDYIRRLLDIGTAVRHYDIYLQEDIKLWPIICVIWAYELINDIEYNINYSSSIDDIIP